MNSQVLRNEVLRALKGIAPEVEVEQLHTDRLLREEVDLDSMDWLRFIEALNRSLGVAIPEADYRQVDTLDKLIAYLGQRRQSSADGPSSQT
ncbi:MULTISPECIES: acyl carrier protein [Pseudomonas]|jgi:acyl carrier protein|uniref:acyl carrier protein n=1 Tax=Pseudomonas TaxID=286 RepID=UPI000D8D91AA|nr:MULTISPECIES: acyl carrier protein [Pseudomonas]MDP9687723.1 acyl carrier protein [Pseudomonas mohnii]MBD0678544.1 phosphopantetheine-binding protein [Pseudomonas sp. PSB11]MCK8682968.1 acyl carrier protein [Pseudomonas umsongensis]MDI3393289.1 acyl carrier protein [Pseudomonas sp. V98_8]NWL21432.1 phosphopantetheine-binding protein [Pseudomonas umsongensis]